MRSRTASGFWAGLSLRESLAACFCATFIVISNMFLRIPLHIPGHRVFPIVFFLLVGRASIRSRWAGTAIGLFAGAALLALGRENPAHFGQYFAAGIIADLTLLIPGRLHSVLTGAIAGALIGATWLPVPLLLNRLLGMTADVAIWNVVIKNGWAIVFGAIGGALAFPVSQRLRVSGLIPSAATR